MNELLRSFWIVEPVTLKVPPDWLMVEVEPDDSEALLQAMTCIRDVRLRTELVNSLFEPLRVKAALLKKYDLMLSEEYIDMLDQALLLATTLIWSSTRHCS